MGAGAGVRRLGPVWFGGPEESEDKTCQDKLANLYVALEQWGMLNVDSSPNVKLIKHIFGDVMTDAGLDSPMP